MLCNRWIHKFLHPSNKYERDKIVLNFADAFNSNNNAGFNLTNFKVQFINQFFQDVINDYEKSVIGTFTKLLLENLSDQYELYFTITKFENDIGFSLIHQEADDRNQDVMNENSADVAEENADDEEVAGRNMSPSATKARVQRKALLNRHGVIPEYIKVQEIYQVYTAFTQANLKNSILHQKAAHRLQEQSDTPITYKETELKEDVLLVQFKLVDKASYRTLNTLNFINIPLAKMQDNNVSTLLEIMSKLKKPTKAPRASRKESFIPYRKSIMTRVLAEQLQRNNFLVLSHFSKASLHSHFKLGSGPARGLFAQVDSLFADKKDAILKKKLSDAQAIKYLQQKFKRET